MREEIKAGVVYFVAVFAAGIAFGVLRVFLLALLFGTTLAVIVELPFMLAIAWFLCRWIVDRFGVSQEWRARATMGAAAFVLLIAAELVLSILLLGRSFGVHLATYLEPAGYLGLAGQIAFAVFPLIQARMGR